MRVDLVPCKKQCKECPENYIRNEHNKCMPAEKCKYPNVINGSTCVPPDRSILTA